MKRIWLLMIVMSLMFFDANARRFPYNGKIYIKDIMNTGVGLSVGVFNSTLFSMDTLQYDFYTGFNALLTGEFCLTDFMYLRLDGGFYKKGFKGVNEFSNNYTLTYPLLQTDFYLKFKHPQFPVYALLGGYFSYAFTKGEFWYEGSETQKFDVEFGPEGRFTKTDYGLNLGLGAQYDFYNATIYMEGVFMNGVPDISNESFQKNRGYSVSIGVIWGITYRKYEKEVFGF